MNKSDGAVEVARLNELLDRLADTLTRQDRRIAELEKAMAAASEILTMQRRALEGHQAAIEALSPSQPLPDQRRAVN